MYKMMSSVIRMVVLLPLQAGRLLPHVLSCFSWFDAPVD